jgi:O-antigen/teichoic acid export membrane protein
MDKALQMGKSSTTGSFHLLIGVVASTVIMAVGTLFLAGLLSDNELGLYFIVLIPSTMIAFFRDLGVNSAMIQQIASLRAANKESEIHDVIVSGIIFELLSGSILSLVCFAVAQPIALILRPDYAPLLSGYISLMSLSILAGAVFAAASAIFVGFEKMKFNSFTQIFQAVVKTALGPFLVILGFSVLGAVLATLVSIVVGCAVGILIVYFVLLRPLRRFKVGKCDVFKTLKPMLKYGIPLTVSGIMIGVVPQFFAFTMALSAGNGMMGNYSAAINFSVLLTFLTFPIATALFPAFSKLNPKTEPDLVKTVFASSVKYTCVLLVPATMVIITLSTPIVYTLFGAKFPSAPLFLALSSLINLFVMVGNISLGTFQTGIGKTGQVMKQSLLSLAVGLPLGYLMVSYFKALGGESFAVIGGIIGILVSSTPGMVWGLYWIWKNYKVKADFWVSAKIFAASAIASVVTYLFLGFFHAAYWMMLVVGFVLFLVVYLASAPLLGAVNRADIENLKAMFSGLGILSKVLNIPLHFMRKISKESQNNKRKLP